MGKDLERSISALTGRREEMMFRGCGGWNVDPYA